MINSGARARRCPQGSRLYERAQATRFGRYLLHIYGALFIAFLYGPLLLILIYSLIRTRSTWPSGPASRWTGTVRCSA
jgi:ABC-type spermidine/putrescine transport system permease subunit II